MKSKAATLRQISALVLTGIYLAFWALVSLHHFILHDHDHHEQKTCHAAPGEKHFHSEEYAGVYCSICQIAPSLAEPLKVEALQIKRPETSAFTSHFGETAFHSASSITSSQPRAPPVRPA